MHFLYNSVEGCYKLDCKNFIQNFTNFIQKFFTNFLMSNRMKFCIIQTYIEIKGHTLNFLIKLL